MKVLFVCRANVGRSQIAMEIFNRLSKKNHSSSAGTAVKVEGKKLDSDVIEGMKELGYDLSRNTRKKLTEEMANDADKIISMAQKETWPDYLKKSSKVTFWKVPDGKGKSYEFKCKMRDQVKELVEKLVEEIG